ncbi:hypothetical protein BJX68DRAFT_268374 [Aspergillus pseudodeflectus]|uniref:FAD/NAD(P)-binding domain-containing protein n=1 Tax=Aspergillus pseudodeflectus TaxID=176178 RepID=A0ABR4K421_9EURO
MAHSSRWESKPVRTPRPMRVICIGAGASGLLLAYKLQRSFEAFSLVLYEKNPDIGGTWFENRYPGCACDIPAHTYTWSFEPKNDWSSVYASSKEIHEYFSNFSTKYGLRKYCRTNHEVTGAFWANERGGWDVHVHDLKSNETHVDYCDILINASGVLNNWMWPAIPGLETFRGPKLHSAAWNPEVELQGKHVGLIGNGSSGIQILPAILPVVKKLTTFIREPSWVSPVQGLENRAFTDQEKADFGSSPEKLLDYRKEIEHALNSQFALFKTGSSVQKETREYMEGQMRAKLRNPSLAKLLIPSWSVGCRRLTPGVNYLESLSADTVTVVYGEISQITPTACVCSDGKEYPIDVLVCATGFNTSFKPRFPLIGPTGRNLRDEWAEEPAAYLGVAAAGYPNYFMFLGPNCPVGNGPVLIAIETQADYMLQMLDRWQTENIHSFSPKEAAVRDFVAHKDAFMQGTVWSEECRSWYKSGPTSNKVSALWPGSTLHYLEAMATVRGDDWDIEYKGNRFSWLGNGLSQTEVDDTADLAYYIRNHDDGPILSSYKRLKLLNKSGCGVKRKAANIMLQSKPNL